MNQTINSDIHDVLDAAHHRPAVSIVMPMESKISGKKELLHHLKLVIDKVEKEIMKTGSDDLKELVIKKLRSVAKNIELGNESKSIAIYVSPVFEKVMYLNIPVEEKIIIGESFEVRDLVYAKKEISKYLLLLLSGKSTKFFIYDSDKFMRLNSNMPDNINAYLNDAPERVANFSDKSVRKETTLKKFLHGTDEGLSFLLKNHNLPVIVFGSKKTLGYFKNLTAHQKDILAYIHGNYEEATETELRGVLLSHSKDWEKEKIEGLAGKIESAANAKKLVTGIKEVREQASQHKGSLLIVEKNLMYAGRPGNSGDAIFNATGPGSEPLHIKDAVDDIIEIVLKDGGDVEFVDDGALSKYQHIALIKFY